MRFALRHTLQVFPLLLVMLLVQPRIAVSQETVGGPYEVDEHTVVLLHFDDDLTNESDLTADPIPNGSVRFVTSPMGGDMGKVLYLDNGSIADSSYLAIPDTAALDLAESWTMEAWVNLLTYGDTSEDWRWRPKLLVKPGTSVRSQSNYYNVLRGDLRAFNTGFYSPSGGGHFDIRSPNNFFDPGTWYHVVHIRDHARSLIMQLVHNQDRELIHFEARSYDPIRHDPPAQTDVPAYIGINLGQDGGWFDGFIDEMRVSNVVRTFKAPPIITGLTSLDNQSTTGPFEITADFGTLGDAEVQNATLHYRADAGAWQQVTMTPTSGETFAASIPAQTFGAVVQYYVSGEANGLRATMPNQAEHPDDPVYNSFALLNPTARTLFLDFEEGEGTPASKGDYTLPITFVGEPQYVQGDVPDGQHALYLDGKSYLEIDGPEASFLNSSEFAIDFWFNADTVLAGGTRFLIKEGAPRWNDFNYQIWSPGGGRVVPASFVPGQTGGTRTGGVTGLDSTYTPGEWYQVIFVMLADSSFSQLRDADGEIIDETGGEINGTVHLGGGPFRIGGHVAATNDGDEDGVPDGPLFRGKIDAVQVYNYVPEAYLGDITSAEDEAELPQQATLDQNYPNPFNPTTTIEYALPALQKVTLKVYDVLGREVMTLVDGAQPPGSHRIRFDGAELASGIYFYRLETAQVTRVRRMMLVK